MYDSIDKIKVELLAPAGDLSRLQTALHFGADAVYFGGGFSLRSSAEGFDSGSLRQGIDLLHAAGKKAYATLNIFAKNSDFPQIIDYANELYVAGADALIVTDLGVASQLKKALPAFELHLSTQANTLNKYAARAAHELGFERIVLARELSLSEIREIRDFLPDSCKLEAFVHGAMCISYSGRCLLSNYLSGRDANRGRCVQACRWQFEIREKNRGGEFLPIEQDGRGTYILNSRDLNMIAHIRALIDAGVYSFKIEGRMKTEYYVGTVVNAYRRALDLALAGHPVTKEIEEELLAAGHRSYTTAYYLGENNSAQNLESSKAQQTHDFAALVLSNRDGFLEVEQRNRFKKGDVLEAVSAGEHHGAHIKIEYMEDADGAEVEDAKLVQQRLLIKTPLALAPRDMLRLRRNREM